VTPWWTSVSGEHLREDPCPSGPLAHRHDCAWPCAGAAVCREPDERPVSRAGGGPVLAAPEAVTGNAMSR
jgi:hypothetical protein